MTCTLGDLAIGLMPVEESKGRSRVSACATSLVYVTHLRRCHDDHDLCLDFLPQTRQRGSHTVCLVSGDQQLPLVGLRVEDCIRGDATVASVVGVGCSATGNDIVGRNGKAGVYRSVERVYVGLFSSQYQILPSFGTEKGYIFTEDVRLELFGESRLC